jgi:hypothetical protein
MAHSQRQSPNHRLRTTGAACEATPLPEFLAQSAGAATVVALKTRRVKQASLFPE